MDQTDWFILRLDEDLRDADRVLVALGPSPEHEEQILNLHIAAVSQEALRVGLICTPLLLERLHQADAFQSHYVRALNFLAVRPRSVAEVRKRLREKGVPADDIELVIERLERSGYLDDAEFARLWVRERARMSPRGPRLLRQELYQKGIAKELIEEVLAASEEAAEIEPVVAPRALAETESVDDDDEPGGDTQFDQALELARRKLNTYGKLDDAIFRRRMTGFLLRRGYNYGTVSLVLKRLRPGGAEDDFIEDEM